MITTDYTDKANSDSLKPGLMQSYRLVHWLRDVLRNFCSDALNVKDERLHSMLHMQDEPTETRLNALLRVGLPFSDKARVKAGLTPVILVSAGETTYPVRTTNMLGAVNPTAMGGIARSKGCVHRNIKLTIAVVTESYDGTMLLENLIEDFLLINEENLVKDCGMISEFRVMGATGPQEIQADAAGNAKALYQATISVSTSGGVSWITDTQGPVFRGVTIH